MIEPHNIISSASAWMQARGWKAKLAKSRGFEQSLFEHANNLGDLPAGDAAQD